MFGGLIQRETVCEYGEREHRLWKEVFELPLSGS